MRTIWFDLDGTLVDLYGVENWLEDLRNENTRPYEIAKPLVRFNYLARTLNELQKIGYKIGIISWTSRGGSAEYNMAVAEVKVAYLEKHLPSVKFDEINIVAYGTPKQTFAKENDILFDDEEHNRTEWTGEAHTEKEIFETLRKLLDR